MMPSTSAHKSVERTEYCTAKGRTNDVSTTWLSSSKSKQHNLLLSILLYRSQMVPHEDQGGCYGVGDTKGTHVSVFAIFIEGEHNAKLKWPFVGKAIFTLLNQEKDSDHYERTLNILSTDNVRTGTKCNNRGLFEYISHSALESKSYLKDDTLYFRVSVQAADHKPWLECTAH